MIGESVSEWPGEPEGLRDPSLLTPLLPHTKSSCLTSNSYSWVGNLTIFFSNGHFSCWILNAKTTSSEKFWRANFDATRISPNLHWWVKLENGGTHTCSEFSIYSVDDESLFSNSSLTSSSCSKSVSITWFRNRVYHTCDRNDQCALFQNKPSPRIYHLSKKWELRGILIAWCTS